MEDAATAEISRAQAWQWLKHGAKLSDGRTVTQDLLSRTIREELTSLREALGADRFYSGKFTLASSLYEEMITAPQFDEFLTLKGYEHL